MLYFSRYAVQFNVSIFNQPIKSLVIRGIKGTRGWEIRNDDSQISFVSSSVTHSHTVAFRIVSGQLGEGKNSASVAAGIFRARRNACSVKDDAGACSEAEAP